MMVVVLFQYLKYHENHIFATIYSYGDKFE